MQLITVIEVDCTLCSKNLISVYDLHKFQSSKGSGVAQRFRPWPLTMKAQV